MPIKIRSCVTIPASTWFRSLPPDRARESGIAARTRSRQVRRRPGGSRLQRRAVARRRDDRGQLRRTDAHTLARSFPHYRLQGSRELRVFSSRCRTGVTAKDQVHEEHVSRSRGAAISGSVAAAQTSTSPLDGEGINTGSTAPGSRPSRATRPITRPPNTSVCTGPSDDSAQAPARRSRRYPPVPRPSRCRPSLGARAPARPGAARGGVTNCAPRSGEKHARALGRSRACRTGSWLVKPISARSRCGGGSHILGGRLDFVESRPLDLRRRGVLRAARGLPRYFVIVPRFYRGFADASTIGRQLPALRHPARLRAASRSLTRSPSFRVRETADAGGTAFAS